MDKFLQRGGTPEENDAGSKKIRVEQKFRDDYSKTWPCLISSSKSPSHAFCTVCSRDISISHGGNDDCRKHINTKLHGDNEKLRLSNKSVASFFKTSEDENSVLNAELMFLSFIIEHNLPLSCSDHAGPLFRKMFKDSKIALKYGCARTKSAAVLSSLASCTQIQIQDVLKNAPFSIATDGSNDINNVKLYPIVVSYFDQNLGRISTVILSVCESSNNTGEGIFTVLNSELQKRNIPWNNCVSFACDNAATMTGEVKGVVSFLKKENSDIRIQGCACHLIHLAAQKACRCLSSVDCEQFVVDIFYYLNKSSKRQNSFKLCQQVFGEKPCKIFKYVSTRWLSFLQCVDRLLSQWDALVMFCSNEDSNPKLLKIKEQCENPITKLYLLFLSSILPIFTTVNEYLQSEKPVLHMLHSVLNSLFSDLIVRFVKPTSVPDSGNILEVKFHKSKYQKEDKDIVIGGETRSYINSVSLTEDEKCSFYSEVRNFYVTACLYIKKNFPLEDPFLIHAEVANVAKRKQMTYTSVEFLLNQFPKFTSLQNYNFEEEFSSFQFHSLEDVAQERADETWFKISKIENASGKKLFAGLSKLMLMVLLVPHSNATTERVFSIVKKIRLISDQISALQH